MNDAQVKALLDEIERKRKDVESIARMKAMDFVRSNQQEDRISAQQYLHDAEIWLVASSIIRKHQSLSSTTP